MASQKLFVVDIAEAVDENGLVLEIDVEWRELRATGVKTLAPEERNWRSGSRKDIFLATFIEITDTDAICWSRKLCVCADNKHATKAATKAAIMTAATTYEPPKRRSGHIIHVVL